MLELDLQRAGLKKNEAKVYLALQQLGRARASEIIKKTRLHRNLVYQSLTSLAEQQLISKLVTDNVAEFQSLDPSELLHAIERKQELVKRVVSDLKDQQTRSRQDIFAFEGNAGFRTAFWDMIETLDPGEELLVMGIFDVDDEFKNMIKIFHKERAKKGINCKILLNAHAKPVGSMLGEIDRTDVRYLPQGVVTPAVFFVYRGKVLISLPNQRTFFRIENEEASQAFEAYFYTQWNQDTQTLIGEAGVRQFTNLLFTTGEPIHLLGTCFRFKKIYPKLYKDWYTDLSHTGIPIQATCSYENNASKISTSVESLQIRQSSIPVSPNEVWIFGEYVANILWLDREKTTIFLMKNKPVADQYREHFKKIWEHGKIIL